ncbi:MAG TPA: hypothetical protein VH593_26990, partial [Ktedonobacteraceae bacterium]
QKAEFITDTWEVAKAYAGRAAEWVLFLCMIANIIEMLPGINMARWLLNLVLGIQVVMPDIGGMSLASMALHAREQGDKTAAKKAGMTSRFLIGLMIVTLLLVSVGVLFPAVKQYTDMAEKGLILVRVVMTVTYGHVLHSLRSSRQQAVPVPTALQSAVPDSTELEALIRNILVPVLEQYRTEITSDVATRMGQAAAPAIDYQQLIAAMQDSAAFQNMRQPQSLKPAQTMNGRHLRQLPAPVSIEGGKQDRQARLAAAYRELLQEGVRVTGTTLSSRARCNRAVALTWLKQYRGKDENGEIEAVNQG